MTQAEAIARYGAIENGVWANEGDWCAIYVVPEFIAENWVNTLTGRPTLHIYANKDIHDALAKALIAVSVRGLLSQLKTFDGCLMIRDVRGEPGQLSAHAYGLAIDINASTNQLGTDGDMSIGLAGCFTDYGFIWGKTFKRRDPQHMSKSWET